MKRLSHWYQLLLINAYSFGISFLWNAIHPIFLPLLILSIVPDARKNTSLGLLSSIGLIIALIVQPLSGALSDGTHHRWGRRRPWLLIGTLGDLVFLAVLALAGNIWMVAVGYIGLQLCSNLAHGANQGLIPDLVPVKRRGEASGFKSAVEIAALVAASIIIGTINRGAQPRQNFSLLVIASVLVASLAIVWLGTKEPPTELTNTPSLSLFDAVKQYLKIDIKSNSHYARLMLTRFLLLFGTYAVQAFALFYFRDVLLVAEPGRLVSRVVSVIGVGVLFIAYPSGLLSEKIGRKMMSMLACGASALGIALFLFIHTQIWVYIAGGFIGLGLGTFLTVNWAWATSLVPAAEAGKYLGLSNLATAGSGVVARALGPLIDLGNSFGSHAGYRGLFVVGTLAALGALWLTAHLPDIQIPSEEPPPEKNVFIPA
ncbi:MAG: MFS transporter [Anaerolineae bacterium]